MPTIEIISINSAGLGINPSEFSVALIEENKLRSHRGLFSNQLRRQKGVILHIGNPDFKNDKECGFYAGAIIDWDFEPGYIIIPEFDEKDSINNRGANQQFKFKFLKQFKHEIDKLLKFAFEKSPTKKVCFLTDYQFGPEKGKTKMNYTISDFWKQHDNDGLDFNTYYEMVDY